MDRIRNFNEITQDLSKQNDVSLADWKQLDVDAAQYLVDQIPQEERDELSSFFLQLDGGVMRE